MELLRAKARELLENGVVKLIIGYGTGPEDSVRAIFIKKPADSERLIFNAQCQQNLAVYLTKHEIKHFGKVGIVAHLSTIRSILQMASEHQLKEDDVIALGVTADGKVVELSGFQKLEEYVAASGLDLPEADREIIDKLQAMSREERWNYWMDHLSRCIKCYACRASCPMCYCCRCQVEYNQPQWLAAEASPMGNFEWHVTRAMHLAGRCVNCGECGRACPVAIPIHLLNFVTVTTVKDKFAVAAGTSATLEPVMSNFSPDDKEDFIKHGH
jgi:ferredoxin